MDFKSKGSFVGSLLLIKICANASTETGFMLNFLCDIL